MTRKLTHISSGGKPWMVDVSGKLKTVRVARAQAQVQLSKSTAALVRSKQAKKGDVLQVAILAGIQAVKRTPDIIPLCHPIAVTGVEVDASLGRDGVVTIESAVKTTGETGVEMEALTAVSVAALTVYDMLKAVERGIVIKHIGLLEKSGGKSGHWKRRNS